MMVDFWFRFPLFSSYFCVQIPSFISGRAVMMITKIKILEVSLLFLFNHVYNIGFSKAEPHSNFSFSMGYYGNEYYQAVRYFSTSSSPTSKFNESDYFYDVNSCLFDKKPRLCSKLVNKWYRDKGRIWKPPQISSVSEYHGLRQLDCQYNIQFLGLTNTSQPNSVSYVFEIIQSQCRTTSTVPLGGSTFEIFGVGTGALTACSYFDLSNNKYEVLCRIPGVRQDEVCFNLTVILVYEHFDGFSESLHEWSAAYLPLRRLIEDNRQYCATKMQLLSNQSWSAKSTDAFSYSFVSVVPFQWFSGYWLAESRPSVVEKKSLYHSLQKTIETAWSFRFRTNITVDYQRLPRFSHIQSTIPIVAASSALSNSVAQKFVFHPYVIKQHTSSSNPVHLSHDWLTIPETPSSSLQDRVILFIGASHMRYNFDLLIQHFFNGSYLKNVNRKHDHLIVSNWRFDFIGNAKDMSQFLLRNVCSQHFVKDFKYKTEREVKYSIVLQTGAWDLSVAPLRNLINNPVYGGGKQLSDVLGSILSKATTCPGLEQILWLTSVPYPMCYNPHEADCGKHRNYRTNSAIAAANEFFLQALLKKSSPTSWVNFSIIDAYSIIKPRLLLNEDSEVLCLSHYICRVYESSYSVMGKESIDGSGVITLLTQAGVAVVQSIIQALVR